MHKNSWKYCTKIVDNIEQKYFKIFHKNKKLLIKMVSNIAQKSSLMLHKNGQPFSTKLIRNIAQKWSAILNKNGKQFWIKIKEIFPINGMQYRTQMVSNH